MSKLIKIKLRKGEVVGYEKAAINWDTVFTAKLVEGGIAAVIDSAQIIAAGGASETFEWYVASGTGSLPQEYDVVE